MSVDRATGPSPRTRKFVLWTIGHGRIIWALAILLGIPAAARTASLYAHLRSDVEELLPRESPSVQALNEMRSRFPGLAFLGVVAEVAPTTDLATAERFLDDLAAQVRSYPRELVRDVRSNNNAERAFVQKHAPLYIDLSDLKELRARIEARRDYQVAKASGALLDEDEPPPSVDVSDLEHKYQDRVADQPAGHLSNSAQRTAMLFIEAGEFTTGADTARALLTRVQRDVAKLNPLQYDSGLRIGYASDIAINAEELDALETDLSVSSVLVVLAVAAAIVLYYRWWRSIPVLICPLLLATVYAFALASLPPMGITELNSNTAFLGSIIVGNGINVGLILLARYREERLRGASVEDSLIVGVWGARTGTLVAAAAASVAYASLLVTEFRGFRQFGYIGGLGMIISWATAFLLIPPLIRWLDRAEPGAAAERPSGGLLMRGIVRLVETRAPWILAGALLLALGSALEVSKFDASHLEYDFNKLRRVDTWKNGEGYWGRKMDALLGHYLTPTMILCDTVEQATEVNHLVRASVERGSLRSMVARVVSADDVLPVDQEAKIAELRRIRSDLTPKVRSTIEESKLRDLDMALGEENLHPIRATDLPHPLTTGLLETDGSIGRTVLVYPRPSDALWKADSIHQFVSTLRDFARAGRDRGESPGRVAGSIPLSDDILSSIARDAPLASAVSFLGVIAVLVALARRVSSHAIASLFLGVLWLAGATMYLGVRINFANFIAFPITFGIGVDYAANVMSRYVQDPRRDIRQAVLSTGGAVALCSLTTVIGYSSLLLAKNRALFLFGLVAVMGEMACLCAAVVALPAWLVFARKWRAVAA